MVTICSGSLTLDMSHPVLSISFSLSALSMKRNIPSSSLSVRMDTALNGNYKWFSFKSQSGNVLALGLALFKSFMQSV
jgi:hypothetical protein